MWRGGNSFENGYYLGEKRRYKDEENIVKEEQD